MSDPYQRWVKDITLEKEDLHNGTLKMLIIAKEALEFASSELGVTQPGYPAPVANANEKIKDALQKIEALKKEWE
jgi:hypothetical protein